MKTLKAAPPCHTVRLPIVFICFYQKPFIDHQVNQMSHCLTLLSTVLVRYSLLVRRQNSETDSTLLLRKISNKMLCTG